VVITRGLYWGMMESGLAIVACCMPTLHALILKSSIESIVRSIRSATSLQSFSSGKSKKFTPLSGDSRALNSKVSASSVPDHSNPASIHGYAMGDLSKASHDTSNLDQDKIWVNSEFEQIHSSV